jgi:hypothetical protein
MGLVASGRALSPTLKGFLGGALGWGASIVNGPDRDPEKPGDGLPTRLIRGALGVLGLWTGS